MKKEFLILLLTLVLLCGCTKTEQTVSPIQPVTFYYRTATTDFLSADGVIRSEIQDLGEGGFSDFQIFSKYFEGPVSKDLVSPISQDISLSSVNRSGSRLTIVLKQDINSPAELDHTLTYACMVKTGLALDDISEVRLYIKSRGGARISDEVYTASNFLLYDSVEAPNTIDVTLYYPDETGTLLFPEKRTLPMMSDQSLVSAVLALLCSAPQTAGIQSSLPPGTALLEDVELQDGICTVDFIPPDDDFYPSDIFDDAAKWEQAQRLEIMSVVNTLCKLDCINQVQIYVYGSPVEPGANSPYQFLDLSEPWTADTSMISPIREELGEFAGTLCLPGKRENLLHRLTVRARANGGLSREEALLQMLLGKTEQNGLSVPFSDAPSILSVSTEDSVCTVDLGQGSFPLDESTRNLAVRSIAATLTSLPEVDSVRILVDGYPISDEPIIPTADWFPQIIRNNVP